MTTATLAASSARPAEPTVSTWTVDPAHTDITFAAKHMMVTTVRGTFHEVEGELTIDEANPANSTGEIRIAAASLNSGLQARDDHLRSADFFDVSTYPTIVFRATEVEPLGGDVYRLTGDLTIRDVTRPIAFEIAHLGFYRGLDGSRRLGLAAKTTLRRKVWGLGWNVALETGGWLVGEEVGIEIDVAAIASTQPDQVDGAAAA